MTNPPGLTDKHNLQAGRFEVEKDGHLVVLEYRLADGKIIFTHAGIPDAVEGQELGSRLAVAGLGYAREQALAVVPLCSFVAGYIQKYPEYQDLDK
jgi:predicted GNAT family acetyltransferase